MEEHIHYLHNRIHVERRGNGRESGEERIVGEQGAVFGLKTDVVHDLKS